MQLSPEQLAPVQSQAKQIVVVAGPGSGKSRTLVSRIQRLIGDGVDPQQIAAITFTNDAARELAERLTPEPMRGVVTHEDRSVAYNLQPPAVRLGFCGTLHGLMLSLLGLHHQRVGYSAAPAVLNEIQAMETLNEVKAQLKAKSLPATELLRLCGTVLPTDRALSRIEAVAAAYQQRLRDELVVDYDGILRLGFELLCMGGVMVPEYLFVDEVQDSCELDALIYEAMPSTHKFFVGDGDQSIYAFRGGSDAFLKRLCFRTDGVVFKLQDNYRCGAAICAAANNLIGQNEGRVPKVTVPITGQPGVVTVDHYAGQPQEAAAVAAKLNQLHQSGVPLDDCAVLVRGNALADAYADILVALGIAVKRRRPQVRDVEWVKAMTILSLCGNRENDRLVVEYFKFFRGPVALAELRSAAAARLGSLAEAANLVLPDTIEGAFKLMVEHCISASTLDRLAEIGQTLPADAGPVELACAMAADAGERDEGSGVTVGTIHSAKGREWSHVFLPAFEDAVIPAKRDVSQERCLAFVAITRAKTGCHISHAAERPNIYKHITEAASPSRFIKEAGL